MSQDILLKILLPLLHFCLAEVDRSATLDEGREVRGDRRGEWSCAERTVRTRTARGPRGASSTEGALQVQSHGVNWARQCGGVFSSGWRCSPGRACADGEPDLSREADKGEGGGPQGWQGSSVPCRPVEGSGISRPEATPGTKSAYSWHIRERKQETGEAEE